MLDPKHQVEIAPAVQPLPRRVFLRTQQLELRLPVPQHIGRDLRDRLHLADPVVELVWDRLCHASPGGYWLSRSLSPLLGLNVSTLRAVISMLSPVCGLRPQREALQPQRKWPT